MENPQIKDEIEEKDEGNQLGLIIYYLRNLFGAKSDVLEESLCVSLWRE